MLFHEVQQVHARKGGSEDSRSLYCWLPKGVHVELTRRGFLKVAGASFAASAMAELVGPVSAFAADKAPEFRLEGATESPTICAFCGVGCGAICSVIDGELVNLEGDPDNPLNKGGMCAKGTSQFNIRNVYDPETGDVRLNPARQTVVKYRAPGATEWEEKTWEWAMTEIAKRVKKTRDATFETTNAKGVTVNRTTGIGWMGGAALDNEECSILSKLARALGIVYLEHQARI